MAFGSFGSGDWSHLTGADGGGDGVSIGMSFDDEPGADDFGAFDFDRYMKDFTGGDDLGVVGGGGAGGELGLDGEDVLS